MKPVSFSQHARIRMEDSDRGLVTEDEVRAVLANPDVSYTGVDGKLNALGEVAGKRLRICFVQEVGQIIVIKVVNRRD